MVNNELKILASLSLINRSVYQSKQVQQRKSREFSQESTVKILGYDPSTGQFKVKDATGKISNAKTITNSGALEIGSQIEMVSPLGGTPIIDGMPR